MIHGAIVPVKIVHDVSLNGIGIQRFTLRSGVYVIVDQIAVVADLAADAFLTYELRENQSPSPALSLLKIPLISSLLESEKR